MMKTMPKKENLVDNWNKAYKDLSTSYDEKLITPNKIVMYAQYQIVHEHIRHFLKDIESPKILEVGCGGARQSLFLALHDFDVTCADSSPEAIRLAKANFASRNAKGVFVSDDLLNSKLPAVTYDCVMSFGLLEHFEDIGPIINSMTNLLKPGGIQIHCVVPKKFSTDTIMNCVWFPARFTRNIIRRNFKDIFRKSFRDFPHYENSFSAKEYCRVFRDAGNQILKNEADGILYPFIAQLPFGINDMIAARFSDILSKLMIRTSRSESRIPHFLACSFLIVCRKDEN